MAGTSLNRVFLIGNLTRDPELRYIPSGQAVTTFTVATNRTFVAPSGEKKEEASFIRVVTWARSAEVCNEYLRKGSQVFVEGRLQSRSWQGQDGTKRSTLEVVAQRVQFLGRTAAGKTSPSGGADTGADAGFEDSAEAKDPSVKISDEELSPDNEVPF
ncbi:MAG TPA: single-stranded DNA-binding protein [Candidatus Omnitrophota bacterium]|nr:single-stranded DNA-binding protein [Candidatus Omnitrophota bacterium]